MRPLHVRGFVPAMKIRIRQEVAGDEAAIDGVIAAGFAGKPDADGTEAKIINTLREAGALVLSLVAETKGRIVGQVALSPAMVGADKYLCLGPIAVLPECQGRGVGSDLMAHALGVAWAYGRDGVVLMGDPAFYGRFGFERCPAVTYDGPGADHIQVLCFGPEPRGAVRFHPAYC